MGIYFYETSSPTKLSRLDFFNKFTDEELTSIYIAAKTNVAIEIMLDKVKAAEYIELTDSRTISTLQALESGGLIGIGRAAEIAPEPEVPEPEVIPEP